jgi:hypothetical protein
MRHEAIVPGRFTSSDWRRLALFLWILVLVVICLRCALSSTSHSLYPTFANAARNWRMQSDLYAPAAPKASGLDCYRYSPLIAAALTPLCLLPDSLGGILWRLVNAGVLVAALAWWCGTGLPRPLSRAQAGVLFLLVLPFAVGSLNNGQANPLLLGLLLAAVTAACHQRWNLTAACLAGACLLKIYPIAVGLLLLVLYPRAFAGRFVLALAGGLLLPFLMQEPAYVASQYGKWYSAIRTDDRSSLAPEVCYKNLQMLSRVWVAPLSNRVYHAIEMGAGAGMALLCLAGARANWPRRRLLTFLLGLGCCWMTLFGPATESCTYILIAPVLAWSVLEGSVNSLPPWLRGLLLAAYGLLLAAALACWFPGGRSLHAFGIQPLAGLLLLVRVLAEPIAWHRRPFGALAIKGLPSTQAGRPGLLKAALPGSDKCPTGTGTPCWTEKRL